jgi:hypothetical protein
MCSTAESLRFSAGYVNASSLSASNSSYSVENAVLEERVSRIEKAMDLPRNQHTSIWQAVHSRTNALPDPALKERVSRIERAMGLHRNQNTSMWQAIYSRTSALPDPYTFEELQQSIYEEKDDMTRSKLCERALIKARKEGREDWEKYFAEIVRDSRPLYEGRVNSGSSSPELW